MIFSLLIFKRLVAINRPQNIDMPEAFVLPKQVLVVLEPVFFIFTYRATNLLFQSLTQKNGISYLFLV